jgi:hypothetical protein
MKTNITIKKYPLFLLLYHHTKPHLLNPNTFPVILVTFCCLSVFNSEVKASKHRML